MNYGVQGRPISSILFNIDRDEMIIHWNQIYSNGNEINYDTVLNTLLYADN